MNKGLPKLNLSWYKGEDLYTDGDIENVILDIVDNYEEEDYIKAVLENFNWPAYYHLTPIRQNILNWYDFSSEASVLEVGCGMGAITPVLCDRCKSVTAVDLSKRRATIAQHRCRGRENLEVIVGNLNDIDFKEKYDYITLIGVLEYQVLYTDSENPFVDFLRYVKKLLKPNGKLLIAIENRYGIKYWCGCKEDHSGIPFDGINQYSFKNPGAVTFGKNELNEIIIKSGFSKTKFYYPMPDYKLPVNIYTDAYLPAVGGLNRINPYYLDDSSLIANERELYDEIIANNVFDFFANSYLVEAGIENSEPGQVDFVATSGFRTREYATQTILYDSGRACKKALYNIGDKHIKRTYDNIKELENRGISVVKADLLEEGISSPVIHERTLEEKLIAAAKNGDEEDYIKLLDRLKEDIIKSSPLVETRKGIAYDAGVVKEDVDYEMVLEKGYIDLIPRNCFVCGDEYMYFDQEYIYSKVPVEYIMYRAICFMYKENMWMEKFYPIQKLYDRYSIAHKDIWDELNSIVNNIVIDEKALKTYIPFVNKQDVSENVWRLMNPNGKVADIKLEIDGYIKSKHYRELYSYFTDNHLESIDDKDIAILQNVMEIYNFELNKNVEFSFGDCNELSDITKKYSVRLELLEMYLKAIAAKDGEGLIEKELLAGGMSLFAYLVIVELDFSEEYKDVMFGRLGKLFSA